MEEFIRTEIKDYPFKTRNGIEGIVPNIAHDIYRNVFETDGSEEVFLSAKEGRKIDDAMIAADPDAFVKRKPILAHEKSN